MNSKLDIAVVDVHIHIVVDGSVGCVTYDDRFPFFFLVSFVAAAERNEPVLYFAGEAGETSNSMGVSRAVSHV